MDNVLVDFKSAFNKLSEAVKATFKKADKQIVQ